MTNREKYGDTVLDIMCTGARVAVVKGKPKMCKELACYECDFTMHYPCHVELGEWLNAEYVEPQVDWSKVAVDTKILVKCGEDCPWERRYFAKFDGESVFVWPYGLTSWSAHYKYQNTVRYKFAKLAEDEE